MDGRRVGVCVDEVMMREGAFVSDQIGSTDSGNRRRERTETQRKARRKQKKGAASDRCRWVVGAQRVSERDAILLVATTGMRRFWRRQSFGGTATSHRCHGAAQERQGGERRWARQGGAGGPTELWGCWYSGHWGHARRAWGTDTALKDKVVGVARDRHGLAR